MGVFKIPRSELGGVHSSVPGSSCAEKIQSRGFMLAHGSATGHRIVIWATVSRFWPLVEQRFKMRSHVAVRVNTCSQHLQSGFQSSLQRSVFRYLERISGAAISHRTIIIHYPAGWRNMPPNDTNVHLTIAGWRRKIDLVFAPQNSRYDGAQSHT